tara:strand:+ start:939 stop:1205 length:267 start_codon:yes stop_codon:yes gene_type:complete
MSDSEKPVEEPPEYWKVEQWAIQDEIDCEAELEDLLEELKYDLEDTDWEHLHDPEYVKSQFTTKDTSSCILDCKDIEDIKKKIISHFG